MLFDEKLKEIYSTSKKNIEQHEMSQSLKLSLQNDLGKAYEFVRRFLSSYLFKEFDKSVISSQLLANSICHIIRHHVTMQILKIINSFIKKLTVYSINVDYVIENSNILLDTKDCTKNLQIINRAN